MSPLLPGVAPHDWRDCRPVMLAVEDAGKLPPFGLPRLGEVWGSLTDGQRHRFHLFTCEGDRSPETLAVIELLKAALR